MAVKPAQVVVRFRGDIQALNRAVGTAETKLTGLQRLGRATGAILVGGLAAAGAGLVATAKQWEDAESSIAKATNATGADLDALMEQFERTYASADKSAEEVAAVIGTLRTLVPDATVERIGDLAIGLEGLSDVIGGDFTSNADKVGRIAGLWGMSAGEMIDAYDAMAAAGQDFGISGDELLNRMQKHGEAFITLGLNASEAALIMGDLYSHGAEMRTLASGLEIFSGKAIDAGKRPLDAMREMNEALSQTEDATERLRIVAEYGMEDKAAQAYVTAFGNGVDFVRDFNTELQSHEGRLETTVDAVKTTREEMTELGHQVQVAGSKITEQLLPHFQKIIDWMAEDGNLNKALIALGVFFGVTLVTKVALLGTKIAGLATTAVTTAPKIAAALTTAFAAIGPAGWITLAVIALAGALALLILDIKDAETTDPTERQLPASERTRHEENLETARETLDELPETSPQSRAFTHILPGGLNRNVSGDTSTTSPGGHAAGWSRPEGLVWGGHRAEGGIVKRPVLAVVGEAGPEAIVPLDGKHPIGGGINVTINVAGSVIAERDLERTVTKALNAVGKHNPGALRPYLAAAGSV